MRGSFQTVSHLPWGREGFLVSRRSQPTVIMQPVCFSTERLFSGPARVFPGPIHVREGEGGLRVFCEYATVISVSLTPAHTVLKDSFMRCLAAALPHRGSI